MFLFKYRVIYDSNQTLDSKSQKLSLMFQRLAFAVITDDAAARVQMNISQDIYSQLNDNHTKEIIKQKLAQANSLQFKLISWSSS